MFQVGDKVKRTHMSLYWQAVTIQARMEMDVELTVAEVAIGRYVRFEELPDIYITYHF